MSELLKRVLDSHGGLSSWHNVESISVELSFGGLAFASKFVGGPHLKKRATVLTSSPKVIFDDFYEKDCCGVFTPHRIWIEKLDGSVLTERKSPRMAFSTFRHHLWWDRLDLLYFTGYALWNYLTTPFLLSMEGVRVEELGFFAENGDVWQRLGVYFPETVPTHSQKQVFYFDCDYRLRRFDYDPEVYASCAKATHYCYDYKRFSGFLFPTRRRVYPRNNKDQPGSWLTLVWIDLSRIEVSK